MTGSLHLGFPSYGVVGRYRRYLYEAGTVPGCVTADFEHATQELGSPRAPSGMPILVDGCRHRDDGGG